MTQRPRALDLFCCAGGASMGLHRAGFEVTGVDLRPQPEYPFRFIQGDALEVDLAGYDFIWASPPCQAHSSATRDTSKHADLIPATRARLERTDGLWVIENVLTAPVQNPILLCGAMFGLRVIRHRLFEANFLMLPPVHPPHRGTVVEGDYVTAVGKFDAPPSAKRWRAARGLPRTIAGEGHLSTVQAAMGIDWMKKASLAQAIPPAYGEWIGRWAMRYLATSSTEARA